MTVESDGYLFCLFWTDDRRVQYGRKIHFGFVGSGQKRHSGCLVELVLYFIGLDGGFGFDESEKNVLIFFFDGLLLIFKL
jgi:hypothetical protein